jgi:hypothetical protein
MADSKELKAYKSTKEYRTSPRKPTMVAEFKKAEVAAVALKAANLALKAVEAAKKKEADKKAKAKAKKEKEIKDGSKD